MKLNRAVGLIVCFCAVILLAACQSTLSPGDDVKTFYVGPAMKDGVGVGPMTCLMVKQSPDSDYQMFYSQIEGFDYVPGYEYELKVKVSERDRVPEDASEYVHELVEVVSKKPAGLAIDNTAWELSAYLSVSGTMDPRVEKSIVNMKIADGKISGNAGANRFFGGVELDGSSIRVSATGSTMMMGTPELMAQENQFLKLLQHTVAYQIVGEELRLKNAEGKVVLVFKPAVEPTLTSNVWRATGINNGKGGVVSLLADTEVTAKFDETGTVSGSSGCNNFTGSYEISGNSLKIGPLAGTRKMCAKPEGIMEQEANVLRALEKATTFNIDESALKLRDENGSLQIKFMLKEQ